MSRSVSLNNEFYTLAEVSAKSFHRSTAKQIEYWGRIGKIAEENPDLPFHVIQGILRGLEEYNAGLAEPYDFKSDP